MMNLHGLLSKAHAQFTGDVQGTGNQKTYDTVLH